MTAPLGNDDKPDAAPRRKWQDELNDLLKNADLPPRPGEPDPLCPSDAELRSAFELEQREALVLDAWKQRMGFDLWCLRHFAITIAPETASEAETALRGLHAADNIRRFVEHEIEDASPCDNDHCKHHHDGSSTRQVDAYRAVLDHVAVLETRIRSLNPEAAAVFDSQNAA